MRQRGGVLARGPSLGGRLAVGLEAVACGEGWAASGGEEAGGWAGGSRECLIGGGGQGIGDQKSFRLTTPVDSSSNKVNGEWPGKG